MSHTRWGPREEEAGKERRQHSWPSVALPLPRCDVFPGLGSEAQLLPLCSSKSRLASRDPLGPGKAEVGGRGVRVENTQRQSVLLQMDSREFWDDT